MCASCGGPAKTDCYSCAATHPFKLLGRCYSGSCPKGFAPDFEKRCVQCDASCRTCDAAANATSCTSCHAGSALPVLKATPQGKACVGACPSGTYTAAGGLCAACDASCVKCSGASAANCTSCAPPLVAVRGVCALLKSSSATVGLKLRSEGAAFNEMVALKNAISESAGNGPAATRIHLRVDTHCSFTLKLLHCSFYTGVIDGVLATGNGTLDIAASGTSVGSLGVELPPLPKVVVLNESNGTHVMNQTQAVETAPPLLLAAPCTYLAPYLTQLP